MVDSSVNLEYVYSLLLCIEMQTVANFLVHDCMNLLFLYQTAFWEIISL